MNPPMTEAYHWPKWGTMRSAIISVSIRKQLESLESFMILCWRCDSQEPSDVDKR